MYRKIEVLLKDWKNSRKRKPLILSGARQTGKTHIVREFAKYNYKNIFEVNFEQDGFASKCFENSLNPKDIVVRLENLYGKRILPGETLIFFDEIQTCPEAITSLKYFCESGKEYHVIAAGSLLGVAINRKKKDQAFSFPVGKVDQLRLYPLDFEEFLMAVNEDILIETIKDCYKNNIKLDNVLHNKALLLYRQYLTLGGMPEAVQEYLDTNSFIAANKVLKNIYSDYISDTGKYCSASEQIKIRSCYESIVGQLTKENKNFKYSFVKKGKNAEYFESSIDWLINAGIAHKSKLVEKPILSLENNCDDYLFRVYLSDVGLFRYKAGIKISDVQDIEYKDSLTGVLAENYVAQELSAYDIPLYYWKGKADAEIEFLLEFDGGIVPLEVKAGKRVSSPSLEVYRRNNKVNKVFRVSQKNFGLDNNIKSVPLYAVFCLAKELQDYSNQ